VDADAYFADNEEYEDNNNGRRVRVYRDRINPFDVLLDDDFL
jgi:hypothetical protein